MREQNIIQLVCKLKVVCMYLPFKWQVFYSIFFAEIMFLNVKLHTERVTTLMTTGNVGYDNFLKNLVIYTRTDNNAAPIQLSIIVLECLGSIILGLYVASYKIYFLTDLTELIYDRNTNKRNWFDRNGSCDIWSQNSVNENACIVCSRVHTQL